MVVGDEDSRKRLLGQYHHTLRKMMNWDAPSSHRHDVEVPQSTIAPDVVKTPALTSAISTGTVPRNAADPTPSTDVSRPLPRIKQQAGRGRQEVMARQEHMEENHETHAGPSTSAARTLAAPVFSAANNVDAPMEIVPEEEADDEPPLRRSARLSGPPKAQAAIHPSGP